MFKGAEVRATSAAALTIAASAAFAHPAQTQQEPVTLMHHAGGFECLKWVSMP